MKVSIVAASPTTKAYRQQARLFGFGTRSGVPLPFERGGVVPDRDYYDRLSRAWGCSSVAVTNGMRGDTINLAIGQGTLLVTPLQMANAYAVLASGGKLHQPNIAAKITDSDGRLIKAFRPRLVNEVSIPAYVSEPLLDGLNGRHGLQPAQRR